jgi:hypothetical protein
MREEIMPLGCIKQWQFQKYKSAMIPVVIILAGFILTLSRIEIPYISIILGLSLVAYFAVLFIYRYGDPKIPEQNNVIVSPVTGKVFSVDRAGGTVQIRIAKAFIDPIDLRCPIGMKENIDNSNVLIPFGDHEIQMSFGEKKPFIFHEPGKVAGSFLGLLKGSYHVTIRFDETILNQTLTIKKGDIVHAGETILAELTESIANPS